MFTNLWIINMSVALLCASIGGCAFPRPDYAPLTHTVSLKNIGKDKVFDAILIFGQSRYKMGILPPGIAKNISRSGDGIPSYATAEWRRADDSVHKGKVRIEKPKDMDQKECYVIQIDDSDNLSLKVEFQKPIPKVEK